MFDPTTIYCLCVEKFMYFVCLNSCRCDVMEAKKSDSGDTVSNSSCLGGV